MDGGEHGQQLVRLAAVADGQQDIPFGDHAQIAVHRLNGMHEDGARAGARKSRRYLLADVSAFADAAHHDLSALFQNVQTAGDEFHKGIVKVLLQGSERLHFDVDHFRCAFQYPIFVHSRHVIILLSPVYCHSRAVDSAADGQDRQVLSCLEASSFLCQSAGNGP